jgi:membrane associated rhomboid family serine protease
MPRQIIVGPDTKIVNLGGRPPRSVMILLILQVGLFVVWAFANGPAWIALELAASGSQTLHHLKIWQPITALWLHLRLDMLILNALSLWIFGTALAKWWGEKRFVKFWFITGVAGLALGVFAGLFQPNQILFGSSGSTVAMLVAIAYIFTNHLVFFYGLLPLKAKHLSLVLFLFLLLRSLLSGEYLWIIVELGGGAAALLFLRPRRTVKQASKTSSKGNLRVLQGGKKDKPHYWN